MTIVRHHLEHRWSNNCLCVFQHNERIPWPIYTNEFSLGRTKSFRILIDRLKFHCIRSPLVRQYRAESSLLLNWLLWSLFEQEDTLLFYICIEWSLWHQDQHNICLISNPKWKNKVSSESKQRKISLHFVVNRLQKQPKLRHVHFLNHNNVNVRWYIQHIFFLYHKIETIVHECINRIWTKNRY